jgi:hypothetical protein
MRRTNDDRRRRARLSDLVAERARLQHALDLARLDLAAGWRTPSASELSHACRAALKEWEGANTAVSAELTAQRNLKEQSECGKSN